MVDFEAALDKEFEEKAPKAEEGKSLTEEEQKTLTELNNDIQTRKIKKFQELMNERK